MVSIALMRRRRYPKGATFVVLLVSTVLFNLFWYGAFLSFPLIGEDGAANYSFLLENMKNGHAWTWSFPIKWQEGLAQPNLFVTFTFDPFSWLMLLPLSPADSFRLSMMARATACWLGTYLFVLTLFKGARQLAATAAFLNMLLNFTLGHTWAIPTVAGIPNSTHYAMFPFVLLAVVVTMHTVRWVSWADVGLILILGLFLITFPLSAIIGFVVVLAFTCCMAMQTADVDRRALRGAIKVAAVGAGVLLAPGVGLWHAWSALVNVSARVVFADELFTYPRSYSLPYMWTHTPLAIRLCLVLAFALVLYPRPWPKPLRIVVSTLVMVVGAVQVVSFIHSRQFGSSALDRLPRTQYFEFYTPLFYAVTAAFALCRWPWLLPIDLRYRSAVRWTIASIVFISLTITVITERSDLTRNVSWACAVTTAILALGFAGRRGRLTKAAGSYVARQMWRRRRIGIVAVVVTLIAFSVWTWAVSPGQFHVMFARTCHRTNVWCGDVPGLTIGAIDTPITQYLRSHLLNPLAFVGRAETLLVPSPRFTLPEVRPAAWSTGLFDLFKSWYARAYAARSVDVDSPEYQLRTHPSAWRWKDRQRLWSALRDMGSQGDVINGVLPEDVVAEILEWSRRNPNFIPRAVLDSAQTLSEVQIMVEERNRAFVRTGNGMMLRALPVQGVPVASSYEQALDYLYYLLWTRYVNAGGESYTRSVNFTALEIVHPDRLALLGVRFVIARRSSFSQAPRLPLVFLWRGYGIYEVPSANVAGFSPLEVWFGRTLKDELGLMRQRTFEPRKIAVVSERDRALFDGHPLVPMGGARILLIGNDLVFDAEPTDGVVLAVLPFRYSACWTAHWASSPGRVLRVDAGLVGLLFRGPASLTLRWSAGYGSVRCLRDDRALAAEAREAARAYGHTSP